jgi:molybdate transport system regulatory protein
MLSKLPKNILPTHPDIKTASRQALALSAAVSIILRSMPRKKTQPEVTMVRPRVYLGGQISIGPGKIDLLQKVAETRSIAAAGRELGIPYKRAWTLINSLNEGFDRPVVETATGGKGGGGAIVTPLGEAILLRYRALEARINATAAAELAALGALVT